MALCLRVYLYDSFNVPCDLIRTWFSCLEDTAVVSFGGRVLALS